MGGGCIATSALALPPHPRHGVTAVPLPAQRPQDICYVSARGSSAAAVPRRNHVNDHRIRAGKICCPCSALPRAKTRTRLPPTLGRWRKPPRIPPPCRRKAGSSGMEMAVKLILRRR